MKKIFAVLLVLMLALALVPAAGAQDDSCFGLSAEDCEIIQSAYANMDITSFQQDFSIDFSASGLDILAMLVGTPVGDVTFSVDGSGPFVFTGDGDIPLLLGADMVVSASGLGEPLTEVSVPFAITNEFMYIPGDGEVIGLPLSTVAEEGGDAFGVNPTDLAETDASDLGSLLGLDDMDDMSGVAADLAPFVTYERLADETLMDQTVFPFMFTMDITGLLNSAGFTEGFMEGFNEGLGDAANDPNLALVTQLVPALLAGIDSNVVVTQYVGADDGFVRKLNFDMDLSLDLAPLLGAGGASAEGEEMPPIVIDLVFDVEVSQLNEDLAVSAPEGARELSEEEAEALLGVTGAGTGE